MVKCPLDVELKPRSPKNSLSFVPSGSFQQSHFLFQQIPRCFLWLCEKTSRGPASHHRHHQASTAALAFNSSLVRKMGKSSNNRWIRWRKQSDSVSVTLFSMIIQLTSRGDELFLKWQNLKWKESHLSSLILKDKMDVSILTALLWRRSDLFVVLPVAHWGDVTGLCSSLRIWCVHQGPGGERSSSGEPSVLSIQVTLNDPETAQLRLPEEDYSITPRVLPNQTIITA